MTIMTIRTGMAFQCVMALVWAMMGWVQGH